MDYLASGPQLNTLSLLGLLKDETTTCKITGFV